TLRRIARGGQAAHSRDPGYPPRDGDRGDPPARLCADGGSEDARSAVGKGAFFESRFCRDRARRGGEHAGAARVSCGQGGQMSETAAPPASAAKASGSSFYTAMKILPA